MYVGLVAARPYHTSRLGWIGWGGGAGGERGGEGGGGGGGGWCAFVTKP